jgi:hypothetical protein
MTARASALLLGTLDDLVVDVRDVAHIGHVHPPAAQVTHHDVEDHHDAGMPQVAVVIDGHAAHIHAHLAGLDGLEDLLLAGQAVVDSKHS